MRDDLERLLGLIDSAVQRLEGVAAAGNHARLTVRELYQTIDELTGARDLIENPRAAPQATS
jgi:hypothetical protein